MVTGRKTRTAQKARKAFERCAWPRNPQAVAYHDKEWGVPVRNDRKLFEFPILEGAQAARRSIVVSALVRLAFAVLALTWLVPASAQAPNLAAQLFEAIEQDKELVVEGLLRRGSVDVNARNSLRETPLHRAVEKGMTRVIAALLAAKANPAARTENGETALHLGALNADASIVGMLLVAGADPGARNDDGETVLFWAVLTGNLVTARRLIEAGADPNVADLRGALPLHAAADAGNVDLVRLLLPLTANPKARDREGRTAREIAAQHGHEEVVKVLGSTR